MNSLESVHAVFNTNYFGAVRAMRAVLPTMRVNKSGTIVTISSGTSVSPVPGVAHYAASKTALEGKSP
jgi:short-subunit dehydrogenase